MIVDILQEYLEKYPQHRKTILNYYAWFSQDCKKGMDEEKAKEQLLDNLKFIKTYDEFNRTDGQ